MSHSRHSKTSAYQVYSSKKNSSRHEDTSERKKGRDKKHKKEAETDSDDDVLKPVKPKSLLDLSLHSPGYNRQSKDYSPKPEKHKHKSRRHSKEAKRYESSSSSDDSDGSRREGSWDNSTTKKRYSDSDNEDVEERRDDGSRDKRSWRESSRHSSSVKPLVVDMSKSRRTRDEGSRSQGPKSLIDGFFPPVPASRQRGLLGNPGTGLLGKPPALLLSSPPSNKYSSTSDRQSGYSDRSKERSSYSRDRPNYSNDRQNYSNDRPSYSNDRPNYSNDRPSYSNDRSNYSNDRPSYSNDRSSYSNMRSSYSNQRPSYSSGAYANTSRPSYSNDRSYGYDDRRSYPTRHQEGGNKRRDNDGRDWEGSNKRMKVEDGPNLPKIQKFGDTARSVLVIPAHCSSCGLQGRAKVTVLLGAASIMGCVLKPRKAYPVYSPLTGGLVTLQCSTEPLLEVDVREELARHGCSADDIDAQLKAINESAVSPGAVAVVLVQKLESAVCDFITSLPPFTMMFALSTIPGRDHYNVSLGVSLHKVGLRVAPIEEYGPPCVGVVPEYQAVMDKWGVRVEEALNSETETKPPSILCCGPKNTGKSTFNRMLINTALKSAPAVAYIDCDIGQTEFSPPGTLSLHIITEPVLGPPFCHQRHAESMVFFGDISAATDPSLYLTCLAHVVKAYTEMTTPGPLPLVINTMGWTDGIGLMLLMDTVTLTQPDVVVQIEGFNQATNLPAITHETVALKPGWKYNTAPIEDPKVKMEETHQHDLLLLQSQANPRRDQCVKLQPVDLRNVCLLSALGLGLERGETLYSLRPHVVPLSSLAVHVCHQHLALGEMMVVLDTSVVALCVADTSQLIREDVSQPKVFHEMPVCECLGLGIVRGIDVTNGLLYLVTSLPEARLRRVNTLMKGALTIPDQLIMKQKSSGNEDQPYVDALTATTGMTGLQQRDRMPRAPQNKD